MTPLDIAIAGCGPAGLSSALLLQRDGHRVRLFDQLDRPAPVGSGLLLQPTGLAVLAELGLASNVLALGQRIERLFGRTVPSNRVVLDVRYRALRGERFGVAVHRAALFEILFAAVTAAAIPIETGCEVTEAPASAGGRRALTLTKGRRAGTFDLVIDALGVRSPLAGIRRAPLRYGALWANLLWPSDAPFDPNALEQRYRRASRMIGVLPIGRIAPQAPKQAALFWSLKRDAYEPWRAAGLEAWKAEVRALWPDVGPLLAQITAPEQLVMADYVHHTLAKPSAPGLVHLGDAAHATSPQLGQGANMALLDAASLSVALRRAASLPEALTDYVRLRRAHVWLYQTLSALLTPAYQSDSAMLPGLRDWIVSPLATITPVPSVLAALVAGLLLDPLKRVGLDVDAPLRPPESALPSTP